MKLVNFDSKKCILLFVSDITDREKVLALEQINNFNKNLINSVSHELRTQQFYNFQINKRRDFATKFKLLGSVNFFYR